MLLSEEENINIYTSTIVSNLSKDLINIIDYTNFISSMDDIKSDSKNKLDHLLLFYNDRNPNINNFFVFDSTGLIISSPKMENIIGLNVFDNPEFNIKQIYDKVIIRSATIDNRFSIIIYMPVVDNDDQLVGMLAGFLNLENEDLQIYDSIVLPYYYDWKILLVDKLGMLIYHSHLKANELTLEERDYSSYPSVNNALKGEFGLKTVNVKESVHYTSSEFVPISDWIVIVEVPKYIVIEKVNKILKRQALYIIISFIILLIIFVFLIDKIITPLEYLTSALNNYGEEKDVKLLKTKGNDEASKAISAFNNMIDERNNLEREIIKISEDERRRIGLDLHDDIGQILTGIAFQGMMLKDELKDKNEITYVEEISNLTSDAINKVKLLAKGLSPVTLSENGLIFALEELLNNIKKIYNIGCVFKFDDVIINDKMVSLNLFHIIQEAVNNAVKHGKPSRIDLLLKRVNNEMLVEITDNGSGFEKESSTGMGLKIMKYRARLINASFKIESQKGRGTIIKIKKTIKELSNE